MSRKLVFLALTVLSSIASGGVQSDEQPLLPNEGDYAAQENGRDCSVIRTVLRNAESDFNKVSEQRQSFKLVIRQSREALEACAKRFSLPLTRDPRAMALVAEACSAEYDAWISAGAHYRMLREDDEETGRSIRTLVSHALRHCQPLPELPAALPEADEAPSL